MARINPTTLLAEGQVLGMMLDMLDQGTGSAAYQSVTTGTTGTATAAQLINGVYSFSAGTTYGLTTPTAAALVAALINVEVGTSFILTVYNANSGTFTLTAGSGVTVAGLNTAATGTARSWRFVVTNATSGAEAVVAVPMA